MIALIATFAIFCHTPVFVFTPMLPCSQWQILSDESASANVLVSISVKLPQHVLDNSCLTSWDTTHGFSVGGRHLNFKAQFRNILSNRNDSYIMHFLARSPLASLKSLRSLLLSNLALQFCRGNSTSRRVDETQQPLARQLRAAEIRAGIREIRFMTEDDTTFQCVL